MSCKICFQTAALALLSLTGQAADWPQWRGPNRDGAWNETGILKSFPAAKGCLAASDVGPEGFVDAFDGHAAFADGGGAAFDGT